MPKNKYRKLPIDKTPPHSHTHTHTQTKICPPLTCIEMNSTFYEVLKLKKAIKFKTYYDQHCCVACFETLFLVQL